MNFFKQSLSLPLVITDNNHFSIINKGEQVQEYLERSIRQRSDGFVIFDPNNYLLNIYGSQFIRDGYRIKVFDTSDLGASAKYNPFAYVRNYNDVIKLVSSFITGTKGNGEDGEMKFTIAESTLLTAIFSYVSDEAPSYERNLCSVSEMLKYMLPDDDTIRYHNQVDNIHAVDILFEDYARRRPNCLAVRRYEAFKYMAGNNTDAIIKSCIKRLEPFCTDTMKAYFADDELGFDSFGICDGYKTVLFVSAGQSDTFDFLASLMYTQLIDTLCCENVQN